MKNLFSIFDYFLFYKKYIGLHIYSYLIIVFFLGLLEIIGISLFAPLLNQLNEVGSEDKISTLFNKFFIFIGLSPTFNLVLIFILLVVFLKMIISFYGDLYGYKLLAKVTTTLRENTAKLFYSAKYNYFLSNNFGELVNIYTNEISKTNNAFKKFITFLSDIINFSILFVILILVDWKYLIIIIIFGFFYLLLTKNTIKISKGYSFNLTSQFSHLNNYFLQMLNSYKYIKATNTFGGIKNKISKHVQKISFLIVKIGRTSSFLKSFSEFFIYFTLIILLYVSVNFFNYNINEILVVILLLVRFFKKSTDIIKSWQKFIVNIGSINKVKKNIETLVNEKEITLQKKVSPPFRIKFNNVNFSYNGKFNLKNISLDIKEKTTTAIVGPSGSGKSTIINLLTGLLSPDSGEVLINNHNFETLDKLKFRKSIGFVSQDGTLFNDTIFNNICLDSENSSEKDVIEKVKDVSQKANCLEFIIKCKEGFNTVVGEKGIFLSEGQKQRIIIARELFKNPSILILDEATSSIDSNSELEIQKTLNNLFGKITIIIVAHKFLTIKNSKKIYVLKNGKIEESGNFDQLIKNNNSIFSSMWFNQFKN